MKFYTDVLLLGDDILYRGYEHGEPVQYREKIRPTLFFVPQNQQKESKFRTLDGRYAHPKKFDGARDARKFIEQYEAVDGMEVHGYDRFIYQFIADKFPDEIRFDMSQMKIYTIDIEVGCDNGFPSVEACQEEMLCITVKNLATKEVITWGTREFEPAGTEYRVFWKEQEMLEDFHSWWINHTPDIITGWNCNLYDIPYICRRLERVLGEKWKKSLSPWNRVLEREIEIHNRKHISYDISGVAILDYLDLYKKFTYSAQESYRLDHIANVELGQAKIDHSEYENFKEFYTKDWQKFVEYNIVDVELVDRLEDKMKLIELALTMAYDAKVNFVDVMYQVRMWDTIIYNYLKKGNIVIPPRDRSEKSERYEGAYVKQPVPGVYDWVVSFDLNSLYPHLMMQYNISPETLVEEKHPSATIDRILNKEITFEMYKDYAVCANGAMFRKDIKGFMPELMEKMYAERKIFKKKMLQAKQEYEKTPTKQLEKDIAKYNNFQMARKIALNSCYGAIGNQYFRFFKLANAEAITLSGQTSIRWIENKVNGYLNNLLQTENTDYVIASDTDSIHINFGPVVTKFLSSKSGEKATVVSLLNKVCEEKLEPFIEFVSGTGDVCKCIRTKDADETGEHCRPWNLDSKEEIHSQRLG